MKSVKLDIKRVPLVTEDSAEYKAFFHSDRWGNHYLVKTLIECLPDFDGMDAEAKKKYKLKSIKEDWYIVGMEVMSDKWICAGFCGELFSTFGLILEGANPVVIKGDNSEKSMVLLRFEHVYKAVNGGDVDYVVSQ